MLVSYRSGDMWAPRLDTTEALHTEALHFIDCIENKKQPETDGCVRSPPGAHCGGRGRVLGREGSSGDWLTIVSDAP